MPKLKALYAIEVLYLDREPNETKLHRMRNLTWEQLRIFRETVFTTGMFVGTLEGVLFGDGFVIPPANIQKIYVYIQAEKKGHFTEDELR